MADQEEYDHEEDVEEEEEVRGASRVGNNPRRISTYLPTRHPPLEWFSSWGMCYPLTHPTTHPHLPTTHSHIHFQGDLAALVGGDLPDDDEEDQEDYEEVPQGKKVGVCGFAEACALEAWVWGLEGCTQWCS